MAGQQIGYIRVSSYDQNPERQLDGVTLDRVLTTEQHPLKNSRTELFGLPTNGSESNNH